MSAVAGIRWCQRTRTTAARVGTSMAGDGAGSPQRFTISIDPLKVEALTWADPSPWTPSSVR